ncbi:alkene reductase [Prosthecochloris sp. GSB1]|uniref:alkene reductase n=1 Tax=Prosthecochloris sp. GSB1 TaxID=281093 RepID=UPI000B8CD802|nr:alkene reductase [Prosthecochloris sp. GSB1]ASQ91204.1 alkene reductase [Prosthecochloris sp. GSB1]
MSLLFSPATLGALSLRNRVVMAPMTRSRAPGNLPNGLMAEYYSQRATAGLVITEGTSPSPNGLGYPRIPGIFSAQQVEGWSIVTRAVHSEGGKIFLQIMHCGRIAHPANMPRGARVVAPSAVRASGEMYTDGGGMKPYPVPEAMTIRDIGETVREYVQAARNAVAAGFDGVEVHGANGYLIEQFIRPNTNRRNDAYGGSIENRARFMLEVLDGAIGAIGARRVGVRLSPFGVFNDMPLYDSIEEDYAAMARLLDGAGPAYIHLADHSSMGAPEVPESIRTVFRRQFRGSLILSGGYDPERAGQDLAEGRCDLVAVGRPFIANPDLVRRWKSGAPLNEPHPDTFYSPGPEGYTDYPFLPRNP